MPPVQIASLEQHLVLLAWLNRQFGYEHNRDLLASMKDSDEGFDAEGHSFVYHRLISRGDAVSISPDILAQYDDNIRNHLHSINARRFEPITLRYFQYLGERGFACCILRKYVDAFYRVRRERWESQQMVYKPLDERDPNLSFSREPDAKGQYAVSIRQSEHALIDEIERLIVEGERLYAEETEELPRFHFDRHLYQPLLVEKGEKVKSAPSALNQSEQQFVKDVKAYWTAECDQSLAGVEVFLLRNLSRGAGVGFFETSGFYPDFILWIKKRKKQHIVFVEPHGMIHAKAYQQDDKARLHKRLPKLAKKISARSQQQDVTLDSYIVSATSYHDLHKRYDDGTWDKARFTNAHILFAERDEHYDYMKRIFTDSIFNF